MSTVAEIKTAFEQLP